MQKRALVQANIKKIESSFISEKIYIIYKEKSIRGILSIYLYSG